MNASVFQRDIKRLINQSMSVKEVFSTKRFRDDDNLEMVHRSSPVRDRHLGIRHRSSDEIRQHLRRDHRLLLTCGRIPQEVSKTQFTPLSLPPSSASEGNQFIFSPNRIRSASI